MALYGEFYRGLAERIKDQLVLLNAPQHSNNSKLTLECDSHYWEFQGEKGTPPVRIGSQPLHHSFQNVWYHHYNDDNSKQAKGNMGSQFGADGKLTEVERKRRRVKGLCYYCALSIDVAAWTVAILGIQAPCVGQAIFAITGEPDATIEEVVEEPRQTRETNTRSISTGVQAGHVVPQHTSLAVHEAPIPL